MSGVVLSVIAQQVSVFGLSQSAVGFYIIVLRRQVHGTHHKFHFKLLVVEVGVRGDRLRLSEPGAEVYL